MTFCAIFVPEFLLQAVGRADSTLRNRSLALIDGSAPNFHVVAANRLASQEGVKLGMTKTAAAEFAAVKILMRRKDLEISAHAALLDAAWSFSPRIEDTAINMVLLDLAGLTTLFGSYENVALQIKSRCHALGLEVHVAISSNSETARVLAPACPGPTVVPEGEEAQFLKSLPVDLLAPTQELIDVFRQWGVTTCGALAALPVLSLSECVGPEGVRLHSIASGKGQHALILTEPANLFEESLELDDAVEELEPLAFLLGRLLDQLCARLSARALATRSIQLQLELLPAFEKAFDTSREFLRKRQVSEIFNCSLTLPRPVQDPKLLLKLWRLRLQSNPPKAPIQKLHMHAKPDRPVAMQSGLFLPTAPDPDKLELTLARIASVVGENNVGFPELLDSHRPDAIRMQKFTGSSPVPANHKKADDSKIAFRAIRPPVPANVTVQAGRPVQVSFRGQTWKVVQASGPWRSSGEWWEENPWKEDTWDLELCAASGKSSASVVYCAVFDALQQRWFVRGSYD